MKPLTTRQNRRKLKPQAAARGQILVAAGFNATRR